MSPHILDADTVDLLFAIRMSMPGANIHHTPAPSTLPRWRQAVRSLCRGLSWEREWMGVIK